MRKIIPLLIFGFLSLTFKAQDFLGLQSSNYAGVLGAFSNPANIVDSRFVVDVALVGLHTTIDNNYIGVKRSALKYTGNLGNSNTIKFPDSWNNNDPTSPNYFKNNFNLVNNGKDKSIYITNRIVLPSFMISLNRKNAIAFNWSVRNYANVDGISQQMADLAYGEFNIPSLLNRELSTKNLSVQQMAWAEYGVSYARVLKENGEHFFKAGVTVKLLQGLEAAYFNVNDFKFRVSTKDTFSFINAAVAYGHSDNLNLSGSKPKDLYKFTSSPGFGFDIGGVYEWRPKYFDYKYNMDGKTDLWRKDKNKYKLKTSFAVNDIGGIRFKKGGLSNDFVANIDRFNVNKFANLNDINGVDSVLKANFVDKNTKKNFTVYLPTSINTQVDYNIWKPFYINFGVNLCNFYKSKDAKVHDFTTLSIAPRVEGKWFGLTVPVSYNTLAGRRGDNMLVGATVRLGPIIVGSNDIFNYFSKDVFGANLYFLLKVPIPYGHKSDRDKDGISDKKDKCVDVPGVWEFKGCPDRDGDHVQDKDDKCPDEPGVKELQGCPDKDGDGIMDMEDACPDSAGTAEFKGCRDTDGDKIIDRLDECPLISGIAEFKGCPDKDADGTPDKDDGCPDAFGPKDLKGCPDKDADGIIDRDDLCPDQAGPKENKGCPWPDTDKDGVLDKDDNCPQVPGLVELKGCPIPKATEPAPQEVPMKAAEKKIIEKAFATLEFASAKDIIKPKSLPALADLAKLLLAHQADWKLKLSGHTDNQGTEAGNLLLSEKRATAVKNFLMKKGVKDEQVIAEWFGQSMPIDDNKTPKGRQKNRRVEMKILLKE